MSKDIVKFNKDEVLSGCAIILAIIIAIILVSFFINAGLVALVFAAFGFQFTWLKATAIWILLGIITWLFGMGQRGE